MPYVFTRRLSFTSRFLLITLTLFIPTGPVWANALALPKEVVPAPLAKKKKKRKKPSFYKKLGYLTRDIVNGVKTIPGRIKGVKQNMMHVEYLKTPLPLLAQSAYGKGPVQSASSIIGQNEIKELLLPDLAEQLSIHTHTALGKESLRRMLLVHDKNNTLALQESIHHLVKDDAAFEKVGELLTAFGKNQRALYSYWDPNRMAQGHLFTKAKDLYVIELVQWFSKVIPIVGKQLFKPVTRTLERNRNPHFLALNAQFKILLRFMQIFVLFGIRPVWEDIKSAIFASSDLKNPLTTFWDGVASAVHTYNIFGNSRHFDGYQKAQNNLMTKQEDLDAFKQQETKQNDVKEAKRAFDSTLYKKNEKYMWLKSNKKDAFLRAQYEARQILDKGSLLDFYQLQRGNDRGDIDTEWHLGYIGRMIASLTSALPAFVHWFDIGEFNASGTLMISGQPTAIGSVCQMAFVVYLMLARITNISTTLYEGATQGMALIGVGNDFKRHAFFLARGLRSITDMHYYLMKDEYFKKTGIAQLLNHVIVDTTDASFTALMKKAHSKAFKKRSSKKIDRGHALALHPYMQDSKKQLQPALWAIGQLDALYSIATWMRLGQKKGHRFCFVEFLPEDGHAQARIENGTLLMVPHSKPNSMTLGYGVGNKAILSGPNGAGKSIFIKMFGCNVVLAHAFGIAVAEKMELSWVHMLRASIDPAESVKDEMSKFQMQKNRMESVINGVTFIAQQDPTATAMFLTDEPLSGTTQHLAATYMKEDFEKVKGMSQLMGIMATHNEEPTHFEGDDFINYQVCIETLENGLYVPSFTVAPGIPEWWFSLDPEDRQKQKKFADYTTAMKHKKNLEKELEDLLKIDQEVMTILEEREYPMGMPVKEARAHFKKQKKIIEQRVAQLNFDLARTSRKIELTEH